MSLKKFAKELGNDRIEGELLKTIFISLFASFAILAFLYFFKLRYIENFIPKYGIFLFLSILSYALIIPSVKHVRAYREFACMSGMMIGMTIGTIAGFLSGFYIGATNGIFIGGVFGMSLGIFLGIWNGKCCGIMGVMEGIMAGFMGGLMGAMTSVMMLNDNLRIMAFIVFGLSGIILSGLNYMIYKETREMEVQGNDDAFFTIFWSLLLTAITTGIMVFGPRSALFS
ncbi:hypothetical protein HY449_01320 [Candidatus Pacearchaeota archaeon]|nr:hypothetical protein [Candidatus Pacearchaeota archaeon]